MPGAVRHKKGTGIAPAALHMPLPLAHYAALEDTAALTELGATVSGLTRREADRRHAALARQTPPGNGQASRLARLGLAFAKPLPLVLLALTAVNFLTGQIWAGSVIAVIVILSTLLSFIQEYRADRAAAGLQALVHTRARVLRSDGGTAHETSIPLAHVVPGDIVCLAAGDAVPADLRILHSRDLFVDQSALTGESMPVEKSAGVAVQAAASALDLPNMVCMGTCIWSGTATALAVATGAHTDFGRIAAAAAATRELTSFDIGLRHFIRFMLTVMCIMMPLVLLLNGWIKGDWLQASQFAIAVAVGLAPELLPAVVTVNLAKGALAMAGRKCIVKRLHAIQNVGAMDILCTDKTGTLTENRVIVARHVDVDGQDSALVTEYAYLNSHFQSGLRNLLDEAVIDHAHRHHLAPALDYRKADELPFDFERRRMSVILERPDGGRLLICKGAVEEIVAGCTHAWKAGQRIALQEHHGAALARVAEALNNDGFRVIAVAMRELPPGTTAASIADESGMVLTGYIAFLDPPKISAQEALQALQAQGIAIKVLSGDNAAVTRHVARLVGFADAGLLSGPEMAALDAAALANRASAATLFVKLTPQQKVAVIRSLQRQGHVVGYMGDGINDAAALRAADVGISVDSATDIAKESADIILLHKNLMVVSDAVHEGRRVFANITKYLRMSASSNFGNVLSVLGASAVLPFLPMAPVQILLNNLLYDLSQTALATDRVDRDQIAGPRRWDVAAIGRAMLILGPVSALFDYLTFAFLWYGLHAGPAVFQTGWFLESLLSQTLVVHVIRTARLPLAGSVASPLLCATTLLVCACGLALPGSQLGLALGLVPMPGAYWLGLPVLVGGYLVLAQLAKPFLTPPRP